MASWTLAARLKARREELGLSQPDLARKSKISQAYIASLESGYRINPSLAMLSRLAKALNLKVNDLLT